ncbi:MAG: trimethylamine methyltransferase family protein, partial [Deltaproteobacteria bacterium]|nr:trimethylamine methyltransferase family protein [Deltaproteobacteria bacterium]
QITAIHHASLEILARHGVRVLDEETRAFLRQAGASLREDGWVKIPQHLVKRALSTAPETMVLSNQRGERVMFLEEGKTYFGTGSDTLFTIDVETGPRRRVGREDVGRLARLCDALPNIDFIMSMGNPRDVPTADVYLYEFAEMVFNSNKPIVFTADTTRDIDDIIEMASLIAGGKDRLRERPFLLHYAEPISPLIFPQSSVQKLVRCAENLIPVAFPSGANAGGGAPITLAGAMALANAECLGGLVIHQLKRPGAPFLYGFNVSIMDMRTAIISYGAPEWSLTAAGQADMARYYRLPSWGFAGATDAKLVDAQAGAEAVFSVYNAMLSRNNLVHDVGYIEFGTTSSMEMIILVDEIIDMCRRLMEGIPVNPRTLAMEAIERAKARGGFIDDDHTLDNWREAQFQPRRLDRMQYDLWESSGKLDLYDKLNKEAREIMTTYKPEPKSPDVVKEITKMLQRR